MALPTDYHEQIRDAVATVLQAALVAAGVPRTTLPVHTFDDLERLPESLPFVAVACVGPEQERSDWSSNLSSGIGYPVVVGLFSAGVASGAQVPSLPTMTQFRRLVQVTFHDKRLSGVSQVGVCEVAGNSQVFDPKLNAQFQKLTTELVVTAVGRFPRS